MKTSKFFYFRLAATNIKNNSRFYVPYLVTCVFTIMMFYIMLFITFNKGVGEMPGSDALRTVLVLGSIVIAIFSNVILFYTNNFLMKRRKKELALYNILGMEKRHIMKLMFTENLYTTVISIFFGLLFGILFSKLMLLLLYKLLSFSVPFGFEISLPALSVTIVLFITIFFLILLTNIARIKLSNPITLLYGGNTGEKEPKTKILLAITGLICLSAGYYIAITTESPLKALSMFFIAVILVIAGTYCLFTAGSIAVLKLLRRSKAYYYKTSHFIGISGMIYRMKQNAAGLANICILSTMVLVMLSTTISLYYGIDDALRSQFPRNIAVTSMNTDDRFCESLRSAVDEVIKNEGVSIKNTLSYRYSQDVMNRSGNILTGTNIKGIPENFASVIMIPLTDYNMLENSDIILAENELLMYSPDPGIKYESFSFNETDYLIKDNLDTLNVEAATSISGYDILYFIVPDDIIINNIYSAISSDTLSYVFDGYSYYYGFDTDAGRSEQLALYEQISDMLGKTVFPGKYEFSGISCAEANRHDFLSVYGGLFFLGIFLGTLFMAATVLIIYYKQISEGYEDKERYNIMQKVGLSRSEIKNTVRSQVLTVFFLPLLAAGIHIAAAFKMITRLLYVLNLTNVNLFAYCTAGTLLLFALIYASVYALTAKIYYRIVQ